MSPKNYADRGIGTVLALEDILVHAGCHVRNIAHLGIVHGKRDEGVVAGRPREIKAFLRVVRGHRSESVGVADRKARNHDMPVIVRVVDGDSRVVADQFDGIARGGHLFGYIAVVSCIAGETAPIDHASGRALQHCHDLGLRLVAETVLLEFIHILVGQEMDGPGIFGHLSLECALHLPRAGLLHRDTGLDGRDEKPVTVKAEKCHILHSATVRVYRTGDDFLHRRNFRLEIQHDVAVACLGLRILPQLAFAARSEQGRYRKQGDKLVYYFLYHISFLFDRFLRLFLFTVGIAYTGHSGTANGVFLIIKSSACAVIVLSVQAVVYGVCILVFRALEFKNDFKFGFCGQAPVIQGNRPIGFRVFIRFYIMRAVLACNADTVVTPVQLQVSSSNLEFAYTGTYHE